MKKIAVKDICCFLDDEGRTYKFYGDANVVICSFAGLQEMENHAICWVKDRRHVNKELAEHFRSLQEILVVAPFRIEDVNCIVTDYPKGVFFSILNHFFSSPFVHTISDRATVLTDKISENVHIGPGCYIGAEVRIGRDTILHPNVVIDCPCRIGANCEIFAGVVIGSDGFGYFKDEQGIYHREVHYKGVIIGDNVDIGANTCIDRGLLTDTVIGDNVKIGKLCGIGHNVRIDENCVLLNRVSISGSTHVCNDVYMAPGAKISSQLTIGERSKISMGSVVLNDVTADITVFGFPATRIL